MFRRCCWVGVVLLLGVSVSVGAQGTKEITWLEMQFPPFYIPDGEAAGTGIADQVTRVLRDGMKGWKHHTEVVSTAEITLRFRAGEQVCTAAYIRTPQRESFMEFSIPDLLLPPNGITIRREDLGRFGGGKPVSLAALLGNSSLRLGVAQGRSYGEEIDALLQQHKKDRHLYTRFGDDVYATLLELLLRGGVDYIVGYPYEASYHSRQRGIEDSLVSLPVQENPQMIRAHVACPRTDWGRSTIAAIDGVLQKVRPSQEYRQFVERWLGPELLQSYRDAYTVEFDLP